jgi:hypothetical protein
MEEERKKNTKSHQSDERSILPLDDLECLFPLVRFSFHVLLDDIKGKTSQCPNRRLCCI